MFDRDPNRQTQRRFTRRRLLGGFGVLSLTAAGLAIYGSSKDAYMTDPIQGQEIYGEGYTVSGYTTALNTDESLWIAVNKAGNLFVHPQIGPADIVHTTPQIYKPFTRTGITFRETGLYTILLYRTNKEAGEQLAEYMKLGYKTGNFEGIPSFALRSQDGFLLEDFKNIRRVI